MTHFVQHNHQLFVEIQINTWFAVFYEAHQQLFGNMIENMLDFWHLPRVIVLLLTMRSYVIFFEETFGWKLTWFIKIYKTLFKHFGAKRDKFSEVEPYSCLKKSKFSNFGTNHRTKLWENRKKNKH